MRGDVGLCVLALRSELGLQLSQEIKVEVHPLVRRTVERAGLRSGRAAAGLCRPEKKTSRGASWRSRAPEFPGPHLVGLVEDLEHETVVVLVQCPGCAHLMARSWAWLVVVVLCPSSKERPPPNSRTKSKPNKPKPPAPAPIVVPRMPRRSSRLEVSTFWSSNLIRLRSVGA